MKRTLIASTLAIALVPIFSYYVFRVLWSSIQLTGFVAASSYLVWYALQARETKKQYWVDQPEWQEEAYAWVTAYILAALLALGTVGLEAENLATFFIFLTLGLLVRFTVRSIINDVLPVIKKKELIKRVSMQEQIIIGVAVAFLWALVLTAIGSALGIWVIGG